MQDAEEESIDKEEVNFSYESSLATRIHKMKEDESEQDIEVDAIDSIKRKVEKWKRRC